MFVRFYKKIGVLSIDVAVGAMVSSIFFALLFDVKLQWPVIALLGVAVWVIYTYDHLDDVRNLKGEASTFRHQFHQNYRRLLSVLLIVFLFIAIVLLFFVPVVTVLWGAALSALVMAYFVALRFLNVKKAYFKELTIAILYTVGVVLPSLSQFQSEIAAYHIVIILIYFTLAFSNLIMFSYYDKDVDEHHNFPSIVRTLGRERVRWLMFLINCVQLVLLSAATLFGRDYFATLILCSMVVFLVLAFYFRTYFALHERYRVIGDAVFLLPILYLVFN